MRNFTLGLVLLLTQMWTKAQVVPLEPMFDNRYGHTLTALDYSTAIAIGGVDGEVILATAEWYDFGTGQWNYAEDMTYPRVDHTTDVIGSGQLIVIGGYDGNSNLASTEIYDHDAGEFSDGPSLTTGISYHRTAHITNGGTEYILVTGGYDGFDYVATCALLNLTTMEFETAASMNYARGSHTATVMADGRVLVTGGYNPDYDFQMVQCEIYDPATNEWTETDPLQEGRDNHAAILMSDGTVMVSGGRFYNSDLVLYQGKTSCEIYDEANEEWTMGQPHDHGQSYHQLLLLQEYLGLYAYVSPGSTMNSGFEVETTYSPSEWISTGDEWASFFDFGSPPSPRFRYAACIINQTVLVTGGTGADASTAELYLPIFSSVDEHDQYGLSIYPNPATTRITIRKRGTGAAAYTVTDINGKTFEAGNMKGVQMDLPLKNLPEGVYHFRITENKVTSSSTFIVVH